jgi:diguanylate cyclase (GGDEF)-like protein
VAAVEGLARAWTRRCQATSSTTAGLDAEERLGLLVAIEAAAPATATGARGPFASRNRSAATPASKPASTVAARRKALEVAAIRWGARVASPGLVVEQLLLLRHLVTTSTDGERLGRLVDRAMLVATQAATDELQIAAFSDALTGCANRRAFERDLERELARCARAELDLCVVAADLDGLKRINDSEGHAAGDRALLRLVESFRRALRTLDGVYRLGGDEFVLVLPDTSLDDGLVVMNRVERLGAPSFSWGIASVTSTGSWDPSSLVALADDALYERRRLVRTGARSRGASQEPGSYIPDLPDLPAAERRPITEITRTGTA